MYNFTPGQIRVLRETILKIPDNLMEPKQKENMIEFIPELWEDIVSWSEDKPLIADEYQVLVKLIMLELHIFSLAIDVKKKEENNLFFVLLCTIANTIASVEKLGNSGLDYQAYTLMRALLEQYMLLITLTIHPEKRQLYCKAGNPQKAREFWHSAIPQKKFFRLIERYCQYHEGLILVAKDYFEEEYRDLSAFVHNDYMNALVYTHTENKEGILSINLFGQYKKRKEEIYHKLALIAWTGNIFFNSMLEDEHIDINKESLFRDKMPNEIKIPLKEFSKIESGILISLLQKRKRHTVQS